MLDYELTPVIASKMVSITIRRAQSSLRSACREGTQVLVVEDLLEFPSSEAEFRSRFADEEFSSRTR